MIFKDTAKGHVEDLQVRFTDLQFARMRTKALNVMMWPCIYGNFVGGMLRFHQDADSIANLCWLRRRGVCWLRKSM
ncbi:hypothetical protein Hdeb2414_s0009g00319611 [Helianthus debilis subsp. tardiflorus]